MSKRSQEGDEKSAFWKKIRIGATAVVAVGTGVFAVTSAIKRQGVVSTIFDDVKTALHAAPQLAADSANVTKEHMQPTDIEEARAVIQVQMRHAMDRQDARRVQELARQLDQLEHGQQMQGYASTTAQPSTPIAPSSMKPMASSTFSGQMPYTTQTVKSTPMRMSSDMHAGMPMMFQAGAFMPTGMSASVQGMSAPVHGDTPPGAFIASANAAGMPAPPFVHMPAAALPNGYGPADSALTTSGEPTELDQQVATGASDMENKVATRKGVKAVELSHRQMAAQQLHAGDAVEARDPFNGGWSSGTIHVVTKSGLVHVRWDDPGTDAHGKPFHPIGEVYAEQIRMKRRTPAMPVASQAEKDGTTPEVLPYGLQIGDTCYAEGTVVDKKWFQVNLLSVRSRPPEVRVEYISTIDGQTSELLLPSPRKAHVSFDMIRRDKPEEPAEITVLRRLVREEKTAHTGVASQEGARQEVVVAESQTEIDNVIITPDLMCSVCERPDNEAEMLVCDCKAGYHIFCLTPQLDEVPEGNWQCPACVSKA